MSTVIPNKPFASRNVSLTASDATSKTSQSPSTGIAPSRPACQGGAPRRPPAGGVDDDPRPLAWGLTLGTRRRIRRTMKVLQKIRK